MRGKRLSIGLRAVVVIFTATLFMTSTRAIAQEQVLYSFMNNSTDAAWPYGRLIRDAVGNLYGSANGGAYGNGAVFELSPNGNGGWTEQVLYSFCAQNNCTDGYGPQGGLTLDALGNLYGTANGGTKGDGVVFELSPGQGGGWTEQVLYNFGGPPDGNGFNGDLVRDATGNLYGTTNGGGTYGKGTVFELTPQGTETVLYSFCAQNNCRDGSQPMARLIFSAAGKLYGTTSGGGTHGGGTVFELTPQGTETVLYSFCEQTNCLDGENPWTAGVILDAAGNLYGTTYYGGTYGGGTVFELSPSGTEKVLHNFNNNGTDGYGPSYGVILDAGGNLYGTTVPGGTESGCGTGGCGMVFELSPGQGGSWTEQVLHNFNNNGTDGYTPSSALIFGGAGNVYGTTFYGGTYNKGTVFEITPPALQFVAVTPCRVVDTRGPDGQFGGPPIQGGHSRSFPIPQGSCNIPSTAAAYSLNVTVVPHGPLGYLTIWPTGQNQPGVSTMNSTDGRVKANAAIVPAGASGAVSVYVSNTSDVILDIDGYFAPPGSGTYQFHPLTPCRIVDTRNNQDGGILKAGVERDYTIPGNCGVPSSATAYSFNVTVLPAAGGLDYLTVWPKGESQPVVSTLNDNTGTVVANAAIVPAGSENATAFYAHSNNTNLLLDVDGYFAAPGTGGLSMYPLTPCRVLDTRQNNGKPFVGEKPVNVVGSACAPPSNAAAYIFNATVVPPGPMLYLTLWPDGEKQPTVSTLNAQDGFITSNMAIVPTSNGSIDAYAAALTQLILDISGYFAP